MKDRFMVMDSTKTVIATADTLRDAIHFIHQRNTQGETAENFLVYDDQEKKSVGIYWYK